MAIGGRTSISLGSEPFYDFSCTNCAKDNKHTEGERFCVECNETFCTSCLVFHNKIAIMRQHELLDQNKMSARRPQHDLVPLPTSMCTVHGGLVINMYCGQDDLVCCTVCIAENHRTCEGVSYILKKAKNIKDSQEFHEVNASIDIMRKDIRMVKKYQQLYLDRITKQHLQAQASITEFRDQINQHLDELEATAGDELERTFKIMEDKTNEALATLENNLSKLEETAVKLKNGQNESQLFVDLKEAKLKEKSDRKLINEIEISIGNHDMSFVPNKEILQMMEIKSLGTLKDHNTITSVSHHGNFDVKTLDDKYKCSITGACQMLNGNIVITDYLNEKLKMLDSSYIVIEEQKLHGKPMDLCRTSPTEVAIAFCDNKMVQFAKVIEEISLKTSFAVGDVCRSVAYNTGLLYVVCGGWEGEGPGQIQVYDKAGQLQNTFMNDKHNQSMLCMPQAIAISECKKMLYIARRYDGICVVNNEQLIVSGFLSNNVILFDDKGQHKAKLLVRKDGIVRPWSVLYDRQNSGLLVSFLENNHIKVYNTL